MHNVNHNIQRIKLLPTDEMVYSVRFYDFDILILFLCIRKLKRDKMGRKTKGKFYINLTQKLTLDRSNRQKGKTIFFTTFVNNGNK